MQTLCLILAVSLLSSTSLARAQDEEQLEDLLHRITMAGHEIETHDFLRLTQFGEDGFHAMCDVVRRYNEPELLTTLYGYFYYCPQELRPLVVDFLVDDALSAPKRPARIAAASALSGDPAVEESRWAQILDKSKDPEVRAIAILPLIDALVETKRSTALEQILDNVPPADIRRIGHQLEAFCGPAVREILVERLCDRRRTHFNLLYVLIDLLEQDLGEDVSLALSEIVKKGPDEVQARALEALALRGEEEAAGANLWRLLNANDPDTRHAAICSAGRLYADDPKWQKKLFALVRKRDPVARVAAAYGLAVLRTPNAIDALHEMLADEHWKVRVAAIRNVTALRLRASVPVLIERLDVEQGRLRVDIARALFELTGLDLGRAAGRWRAWWGAEEARFSLPSLAEVRAIEAALTERRSEDPTTATFYGLPVFSQRVAIVLDTSGSMSASAHLRERTSSEEDGPTRIDAAREQILQLLERTPDGAACNLIFFATDVLTWRERAEALAASSRYEAAVFAMNQQAAGATNLFDGLALALGDDLIDTIYLLSDGAPNAGMLTDADAICKEVRRRNRRNDVVIHCISVGRASSLLRVLAKDHHGRYIQVGVPEEE